MNYIDYIFKIVVLVVLIYLLYKNKNENFSNISKQDLEGLQNIASMYKNGELKVAKLHVTDNAQFDKDINTKQNIVFNNGNNWIIHAPNDHRHQLYIAPSTGKNNGNWNWDKGLDWHSSGKMHIQDIHTRGNSTTAGKINCNNLHVNDLGHFKRIDIIPGGGKWNTHFNYHTNGENYISGGKLHVRGTNHDRGHIVNGITETNAIRPRFWPAPNGMPIWPNDQEFGNLWSHVKARGVQLGDIIPITTNERNNNMHRMGAFITYDKRNHDGLVHGRKLLVDRHNRWARHPNNHHMTG